MRRRWLGRLQAMRPQRRVGHRLQRQGKDVVGRKESLEPNLDVPLLPRHPQVTGLRVPVGTPVGTPVGMPVGMNAFCRHHCGCSIVHRRYPVATTHTCTHTHMRPRSHARTLTRTWSLVTGHWALGRTTSWNAGYSLQDLKYENTKLVSESNQAVTTTLWQQPHCATLYLAASRSTVCPYRYHRAGSAPYRTEPTVGGR